jgi:hypothetical protein
MEVEPVAYQTDPYGERLPLYRAEFDLGFDGRTFDGQGGADADELGWRGTFEEIGSSVVRNPDMWRAMGFSRIRLQESERAISDRNVWHRYQSPHDQVAYPTSYYLWNSQRGVQPVSYGCSVEHRGYSFTATAPGAIACQEMISEQVPDLLLSYDNNAVNGPHAGVDNPPPGLARDLSVALESEYGVIPFGITDIQPAEELVPGIFAIPRWQDLYDHHDANGAHDNFFMHSGEDIFGYARRIARDKGQQAPVGVITEPPYYIAHTLPFSWIPSGLTHGQFHHERVGRLARILETIDIHLPKFPEAGYLAEEIRARAFIKQSHLNAFNKLELEDPDRDLNMQELAHLSRPEFYGLKPLGLLGLLAQMHGSEHLPTIANQFLGDVGVMQQRLQTHFDSPRRLVRAQLAMTLIAALSIARSES